MSKEVISVVKIINTDEAQKTTWYKNKGGKLYIVRINIESDIATTVEPINDEQTYGWIPRYFFKEVQSFIYNEEVPNE